MELAVVSAEVESLLSDSPIDFIFPAEGELPSVIDGESLFVLQCGGGSRRLNAVEVAAIKRSKMQIFFILSEKLPRSYHQLFPQVVAIQSLPVKFGVDQDIALYADFSAPTSSFESILLSLIRNYERNYLRMRYGVNRRLLRLLPKNLRSGIFRALSRVSVAIDRVVRHVLSRLKCLEKDLESFLSGRDNSYLSAGLYSEYAFNCYPGADFPAFQGDLFGVEGADGCLKVINTGGTESICFRYFNASDESDSCRGEEALTYKLSVIIPVHNNGEFLLSKCIPSLLANKMWSSMEIVIVDDCSDDPLTSFALFWLSRVYGNVRVITLTGVSSGSASLPRNIGVQHASSELVTFIDPDNSISYRGYDVLMSKYIHYTESFPEVKDIFVSGFQIKASSFAGDTARHSYYDDKIVLDSISYVKSLSAVPTISTQAAIIPKSLLAGDNGVSFLDGAVGQDTLFGLELLLRSNSAVFTDQAAVIYYSQRTGSVTNSRSKDFVRRSLMRERRLVDVLKRYDLFQIYSRRFFPKVWETRYFPYWELAQNSGNDDVIKMLMEVSRLFEYACSLNGRLEM